MITILTDGFPVELDTAAVIISLIISLLVPIAFYVLRSIGLYSLAKRQSIKGAFMAWIPCLWIYVACKLVGKNKVFGFTLDKLAIWFVILYTIAQLLTLAYEFMFYFPLVGNYFMGKELFIITGLEDTAIPLGLSQYLFDGEFAVFVDADFVYPYKDIFLAKKIADLIFYGSFIFDIFYIVIEGIVLFNLFRTYWPERFILGFVLSFFVGLTGPMIFAIRKKEPVDFAEFSRNRYNNYNRGPYNNNRDYYNYHQNYNNRPPHDDAPFGNYNNDNNYNNNNSSYGPQDEPFADYMDKDKKD